MPAKEIKELRKSGKLSEAYEMAKNELLANPNGIWEKRNFSWVLVDFIKAATHTANYDEITNKLSEIKELNLPADEIMLYENVSWAVGMYIFSFIKNIDLSTIPVQEKNRLIQRALVLFPILQQMPLQIKCEGYTFLFKGFHKLLKDHDYYIQFADWWNFDNFRDEDYLKEKLKSGKEMMSFAEQVYICYAKHLLPKQIPNVGLHFDEEKAKGFIECLGKISETHPEYTYTEFYKAKLLLALGDRDNMLSALLPFAKKKKNEFWAWDILADAFDTDKTLKIACYCKALTCKTTSDFLVNVHQKLASLLISDNRYNEAKTEIEQSVKARQEHSWGIPNEIKIWMLQDWFITAKSFTNNNDYYAQNIHLAESILYSDTQEEPVIIEFVNNDKKIANFIASETKHGFFKYDRFIKKLVPGDIVNVRFNGGEDEGCYKLNTLRKVDNEDFRNNYLKNVEGTVSIPLGKNFGFVEKVFVHPNIISKSGLKDGQLVKGIVIKSYNKEKKQWGWKMMEILG